MPLKLDEIDRAILKVLFEDGRRSYRQIAIRVGVTTPTVESRVGRMTESEIIKKIAPILDIDKIELGVAALILLKVEYPRIGSLVANLLPLDEVRNIFVTTGEANMILRIVTHSNEKLQDLLDTKIAGLEGSNIISTQVITRTLKDEQGVVLFEELSVNLVCDYCGGEVSGKTHLLNVGQGKRFFCCKTCLSGYKDKYKSRIAALTKKTERKEVI